MAASRARLHEAAEQRDDPAAARQLRGSQRGARGRARLRQVDEQAERSAQHVQGVHHAPPARAHVPNQALGSRAWPCHTMTLVMHSEDCDALGTICCPLLGFLSRV